MARSKNDLTRGLSGKFGKDSVFKTRNGKTFLTKYPDMSNVEPTELQTDNRSLFSRAVDFACGIVSDPARKAAFNVKKKGQTVYHAAMSAYYQQHGQTKKWNSSYERKRMAKLLLPERLIKTALLLQRTGMITNGDCQRLHTISKPTATRDLQRLVELRILESSGGHGSAAFYKMGPWWDEWEYIK